MATSDPLPQESVERMIDELVSSCGYTLLGGTLIQLDDEDDDDES